MDNKDHRCLQMGATWAENPVTIASYGHTVAVIATSYYGHYKQMSTYV